MGMGFNFPAMLQRSLLILFVLLLWGCVHDPLYTPDPQPAPGAEPTVVEGPCDPETVYFQEEVLPLIISNCAQSGCHDAASAEDGIVLESFSSILYGDDNDLVVPGQPGESELIEVILGSNDLMDSFAVDECVTGLPVRAAKGRQD